MATGKVKLAFIENESKRNLAYRKRKGSLVKKMEELSTLCGVEACVVVYGHRDPQPLVWPSESGVRDVVGRLRSLPRWEQTKKMVDQESFAKQRIAKGKVKLQKLVEQNKVKEMSLFMLQCLQTGMVHPGINNMSKADFNVLLSLINQNMEDLGKRIQTLNANQVTTPISQPQLMQNPSYQLPQMQTLACQPQMMQTVAPEDMTLLNHGNNGSDMNAKYPMQSKGFMDLLLNGDGNEDDETIMPPFGGDDNMLP